MHRPKSNHMTRTCHHHMLLVGGVGFYSKITFLTPISRSKVRERSKSYDRCRLCQWSFGSSLIEIGQSILKLEQYHASVTMCHATIPFFTRRKTCVLFCRRQILLANFLSITFGHVPQPWLDGSWPNLVRMTCDLARACHVTLTCTWPLT